MVSEVHSRLDNEKTGHDSKHIFRVVRNAYKIAKEEQKVDYDILIAACLLHDISLDSHPIQNHNITSASKAEPLLQKANFFKEKIILIKQAIIKHYRMKNLDEDISTFSVEEKILCDADRLDSLGSVGLVRMIFFSQKQNIPYIISKNDKLDESVYGNIKYLSDKHIDMLTRTGTKLAKQRTKIFSDVCAMLEDELLEK